LRAASACWCIYWMVASRSTNWDLKLSLVA
jgi:hypothetical protein